MQRSGWMVSVALLCLLTSTAVAWQDDDSGQDAADGAQQGEDAPITDQPGGIQAANESADDDEEEQDEEESPGRFIPSEQISQDLGVSFPADI